MRPIFVTFITRLPVPTCFLSRILGRAPASAYRAGRGNTAIHRNQVDHGGGQRSEAAP